MVWAAGRAGFRCRYPSHRTPPLRHARAVPGIHVPVAAREERGWPGQARPWRKGYPPAASPRLCEPTGRANARPMTGSAKQSICPRALKHGLLRCARN